MRTQHFNIFNTGTESFFTPGTQLANIAAVKPDAPAVIYVSPENKESVMTWRELHELSNRIAWYLLGQGVGPGKSVLAALPNIPTHIALAFGIWKTGACYVPVSNRAPQRNLMEICACVSPALVITNRKKPDGYPGLSTAELRTLCADCPADMPPDVLAIPNLANCSGGTTGKTKVIEQDMPAGESDEGLRTWFAVSGMRFEMRQLLAGPLFHGAPHSAAFNGLYCGNTLIMPAKLDAETIVRLIKKYRIEYVQMVPTLMQRISRMPGFRKEDLASLEVLCHTGGVCSQDLKREWLQIIPPERLYEMYAMTECIGMTSIRDEDGHELPTGEIGEIFMSWGDNSPRVIYKNIPPLPTDSEGFRSVGDMGYVDAEGYLYFADRRSDMIVTGGENVFAAEVEMVLKKHPKVVDAVVIGLPDPDWGHRIHAIVETNGPVGNKDLIRFALNYLPPYKIPKSIELVDHIPVNENGKVVRSKLVEESLAKGY